jgi:hypothetical protein
MSSTTSGSISNDGATAAMQEMMAQSRLCSEANSVMRLLCKRLTSEGYDVKAMRSAIKYKRLDTGAAVSNLQATVRYSGLLGVPVSPETLFGDVDFAVSEKTQHGNDLWDAEESGYKSGRGGVKITENPYHAGSELFVHWEKFWHKGQAALAMTLGPDTTQVRATRRPRRSRQPDLALSDKVSDIRTARKPGSRTASQTSRRPRRAPAATENGATVY